MFVIYKILLVLLYVFLACSLAANAIGIPGNWILVVVALIAGLVTHFTKMTWGFFLLCLGLALLGELIESLLGTLVVAKKGGGRWGIIGSFFGGLMGVIGGSAVVPPIGSVIFGFIGAFAGAVLGELAHYGNWDEALRIGFWSFLGRAMAIMGKVFVGCVIFWIIVTRTWV
ncbi:MAG: DUF456 family protein [Candidatus Latescibacteria bacterium]|nr:DUF456 family protein [Candidatus Latescibacterota bacterium]NIM22612.1 DUF456 family protein [Candidatus Latescibacterota bacterium]NIM64901.1 DUF456 family protein [Candidatus Latescibacterota bacterium]NIO01416.1 DUF456 family protein [Candidatus Latescibacterota bacterium]NIO27926.1 DUF456 family protein [Candidatus Latescibacterota bacterium]